jgi:hypothetical protein
LPAPGPITADVLKTWTAREAENPDP